VKCAEIDHFSKESLKDQIKSYVCSEISSGRLKPGSKAPTQRELAAMFGVSRKTCEVAMRELELENVIFRRLGKGSFVLDGGANNSTKAKSDFVVVCAPNFNNDFFSHLCDLAEKELFGKGLSVVIARSNGTVSENKKYVSMLREKNPAAIIGFTLNDVLMKYSKNNNVPLVNISPSAMIGAEFGQVVIDLEKAGRLMAKHLIGLGHRSIVCAGCPPYSSFDKLDSRFKSFIEETEKAGGRVKPQILPQSPWKSKDIDYEKIGGALIESILTLKERPSAIVFYNDHRALGGMKKLLEMGFDIPGEFSVAGFDNAPSGKLFYPSLTSIDFDVELAVKQAVEMALNGKLKKVLIPPKLVKRQSTGSL
jgi:LacI family transcriptional regulator